MEKASEGTLRIVPFTDRHVPAFTAWFNALPRNDLWNEAWIRYKALDDETYDPELMLTATQDGDPVGFVLGSVAEDRGWIRAFVVHPQRRRQGIGTAMFDAVERTFKERGIPTVHVGWALPRYLLPGVDITYTAAIVFLDRRGYATNRETRNNMDVTLSGRDFDTTSDEARLVDRGITVRRAREQDREAIVALCERLDHHGWAVETTMALKGPPTLEGGPAPVFIALKDGDLCAFATHSICGPVHFGPMLTAPDLRGLGIGSVLLKRCLQDWQRAGVSRCEITWAGPLSFYARTVEATMGKAFWVFEKEL